METNRVLAAVSYFSLFFAPFLVPLILYFISTDPYVKEHTRRALLSHLLPVIAVPVLIAAFLSNPSVPVMVIGFLVVGGLSIAVMIYNIVQGIKVLTR